jgi:hypothetical protein
MNKLSKVLLGVIVVLVILLGFAWYQHFVGRRMAIAPVERIDPPSQISPKKEPSKESLPNTALALIRAGKSCGAKVCQSKISPILMEMATRQARYQAEHSALGHQKWPARSEELRKAMNGYKFAEICATYGNARKVQENELQNVANNLFIAWQKSRRHWEVASEQHDFYGIDMQKQPRNSKWFGCIIVADKNEKGSLTVWQVTIEEDVAEASSF